MVLEGWRPHLGEILDPPLNFGLLTDVDIRSSCAGTHVDSVLVFVL